MCKPGYGSTTGDCTCHLCPIGTYSEGGNMEDCRPCPFGFTSAAGSNSSAQCVPADQPCPVGQIAPPGAVSADQCGCIPGYGGGATPKDACTICPVGTWAPGNNTQPCIPCGFGYTGPEGSDSKDECVETNACPAGTEFNTTMGPSGPFSTSQCVCKAGYGSPTGEGICRRCPAGTYSHGGSMEDCKSCPFGFTSAAGSTSQASCEPVAQRCPIGQFAPDPSVSEKQCRCYPGFGGGNTPEEACTICPVGTYSANSGTDKCLPCPIGFITGREGARNETECYPVNTCPAGTGKEWIASQLHG